MRLLLERRRAAVPELRLEEERRSSWSARCAARAGRRCPPRPAARSVKPRLTSWQVAQATRAVLGEPRCRSRASSRARSRGGVDLVVLRHQSLSRPAGRCRAGFRASPASRSFSSAAICSATGIAPCGPLASFCTPTSAAALSDSVFALLGDGFRFVSPTPRRRRPTSVPVRQRVPPTTRRPAIRAPRRAAWPRPRPARRVAVWRSLPCVRSCALLPVDVYSCPAPAPSRWLGPATAATNSAIAPRGHCRRGTPRTHRRSRAPSSDTSR